MNESPGHPGGRTCPALVRHLGWVVAVKLVLLMALWFAFVDGRRVSTAPSQVAERLTGASSPSNPPLPATP